jgi:hypothetical protein
MSRYSLNAAPYSSNLQQSIWLSMDMLSALSTDSRA